MRGLANKSFKSYLSDSKQYVSINAYDSNLTDGKFGVPLGSVLCKLLLLVYINDWSQSIKFCKVRHFADDTNLLPFSRSVNRLNKYNNRDLKDLYNWLDINKISHNVKTTKLVIWSTKGKN